MRNFNQLSRTKRLLTLGAVTALGATAGCGTSSPNTVGTTLSPTTTWSGTESNSLPYPGRVALPEVTCTQWSTDRPQPVVTRGEALLAVADARRSIPPNCNYLTDSGVGTYTAPSYESIPAQRPDGTTHTPDGVVVHVVAYSLGEFACNSGGGSDLWIQYQETQNETNVWAPVINFGGGPTRDELVQAHIPQVASPYAGTTTSGC